MKLLLQATERWYVAAYLLLLLFGDCAGGLVFCCSGSKPSFLSSHLFLFIPWPYRLDIVVITTRLPSGCLSREEKEGKALSSSFSSLARDEQPRQESIRLQVYIFLMYSCMLLWRLCQHMFYRCVDRREDTWTYRYQVKISKRFQAISTNN